MRKFLLPFAAIFMVFGLSGCTTMTSALSDVSSYFETLSEETVSVNTAAQAAVFDRAVQVQAKAFYTAVKAKPSAFSVEDWTKVDTLSRAVHAANLEIQDAYTNKTAVSYTVINALIASWQEIATTYGLGSLSAIIETLSE